MFGKPSPRHDNPSLNVAPEHIGISGKKKETDMELKACLDVVALENYGIKKQ